VIYLPLSLSLSPSLSLPLPEATEEVSLDSPERDVLLSDGPSPAITPITPPCSLITPHMDMFTHSSFDEVTTHTYAHAHAHSLNKVVFDVLLLNWRLKCVCFVQIEEEEGGDSFDMNISVSDPEKVGEFTLCSPGSHENTTEHYRIS